MGASTDYSPLPVISSLRVENKSVLVARDDLLPGGSKQRGAMPYLRSLLASGCTHFVYASPFSGFAQVTLAFCCSKLKEFGATCTIYCEKSPQGYFHEFALLARSYGADIILCESLADAHDRSLDMHFNKNDKGEATIVPLGFDDPLYIKLLKNEIKKHCIIIFSKYDISELWLPIGSGTLMKIFIKVVPDDIKIYGVNVNVLPEIDHRISTIIENERISYIKHEKKFHEAHKENVPVPSNIYYDAKVFAELVKRSNTPGTALWWNVAR